MREAEDQALAARSEQEAAAREQKVAVGAAEAQAMAAAKERDGALEASKALQARLTKAEQEISALKVLMKPSKEKEEEKVEAKAEAKAPAGPNPAEADFRALRSELDGWKLVAEQAEQMQQRAERKLAEANRTIAALRSAEGKENAKGSAVAAR